MRGVSDFIKEHKKLIEQDDFSDEFLKYHLSQIKFLQHERLVHLIVMLWFALIALAFFGLFIFLENLGCLVIFGILIIVTIFYVLHYFKLENTVISWYFLYNSRIKKSREPNEN